MSECKHTRVIQFFYTENLEPCGLWACAECNQKFAPIDRELALEKENTKLREAIRAYQAEYENPVPDYVLRKRYRDQMFALLRETGK